MGMGGGGGAEGLSSAGAGAGSSDSPAGAARAGGDPGPRGELEYWRTRMQRLTFITDQLKRRDCRNVIGMLSAITKGRGGGGGGANARAGAGDGGRPGTAGMGEGAARPSTAGDPPSSGLGPGGGDRGKIGNPNSNNSKILLLLRRWKQIDVGITEAANEAKDNVKYLFTLQRFIDPLYGGSAANIVDGLPALMNAVKMIHTIARYYNTPERMTGLFVRITDQMVVHCKRSIIAGEENEYDTATTGKGAGGETRAETMDTDGLWEQDPSALVRRIESCIRLNDAYQEHYRITKRKLAQRGGGGGSGDGRQQQQQQQIRGGGGGGDCTAAV